MSLKHTYLLQILGQVGRAGLLFFTLLTVFSVNAADFTRGLEAYDAKDYKTTLQQWRPLAEQGDEYAQLGLGMIYQFGNGVVKNYKEAVKWYGLAAQQGSMVSQDMLISLQNQMTDWDVKEKAAIVVVVDLEKSRKTNISARVLRSQKGIKHLYFIIKYDQLHCDITKDLANPPIQKWFFDNQAADMATYCSKYSDSEDLYFYLAPNSNKDSELVVAIFDNATSAVAIKTDTLRFKMPAKGFSKVWRSVNSAGL